MKRQKGLTLTGLLVACVILGIVGILAIKVVPAYTEYFSIVDQLKAIADDPGMQDASRKDIDDAFSRRADAGYITAIGPSDIDINKSSGKLVLSADYTVRIPLFANISLVIDFNPSSH